MLQIIIYIQPYNKLKYFHALFFAIKHKDYFRFLRLPTDFYIVDIRFGVNQYRDGIIDFLDFLPLLPKSKDKGFF